MAITFIHTADLQLGKTYRNIPGDQGAKLRELRLEVIDRLLDLAREKGAAFILVAGDFFDANTLEDRCVLQTCERFRRSAIPIYVIPGNHDYGGAPDSVYRRDSFLKAKPAMLTILETTDPVLLLDGTAVLLPAPLLQRHSTKDTCGHLDAAFGKELAPDAIRIGMAHGGVVGFGDSEEECAINLLDPSRAEKAELDYLALGDWHGLKKVTDRTWYSGTPEPDRFRNNQPGYVLVVEIEARGKLPVVTPHRIARTRWIEHTVSFHSGADIDGFLGWVEKLEDPLNTVLKVEIAGVLSLVDGNRLREAAEALAGRVLYLKLEGRTLPKPTRDELDGLSPAGFVGETVEELRALAELPTSDGAQAALALQLLYEAMQSGGLRA